MPAEIVLFLLFFIVAPIVAAGLVFFWAVRFFLVQCAKFGMSIGEQAARSRATRR